MRNQTMVRELRTEELDRVAGGRVGGVVSGPDWILLTSDRRFVWVNTQTGAVYWVN